MYEMHPTSIEKVVELEQEELNRILQYVYVFSQLIHFGGVCMDMNV